MSGGDDFLGRWSARKRQAREGKAREGQAHPDDAAAPAPAPEAPPAAPDDRPDEEILRELGLPDPDSLKKGDDFAAFLRAAVPERLRRRALRRLWLSDPVLANLDGLNDYEEDFTDAATVVTGLKTAYRVGRGMLGDEPAGAGETAAEADADAAPASGAPEAATVAEPGTAAAEEHRGDIGPEAEVEEQAAAADPAGEPPEVPAAPPRRMRFTFDS